jgi:hypothetical protein
MESDMAHKPSETANLDQPEMPDAVRRRDQPETAAPGAVPRPDENVRLGGVSPPEDGGVAQHPVHDDDIEDLGPEDYEQLTDEVAKTGIKPD